MIAFFVAALLLILPSGAAAQLLDFTDAETRAILRHGPWPAPWSPDPSNRVSGKAEAIELGERLFFDPRLSPSGKVLCATCHAPFRGWQDGRARAFGLQEADRNTQSLFDVRYNRWFGWDGAGDSLWAQSIRPMLDARDGRQPGAGRRAGARRRRALPPLRRCSARAAAAADEGAGGHRQGARRVPGDAGERALAVRRLPRCAVQ